MTEKTETTDFDLIDILIDLHTGQVFQTSRISMDMEMLPCGTSELMQSYLFRDYVLETLREDGAAAAIRIIADNMFELGRSAGRSEALRRISQHAQQLSEDWDYEEDEEDDWDEDD